MKLFGKKKNQKCFFCDVILTTETTYTLQYTTLEGIQNQHMCQECSRVFDKIAETFEEIVDGRNNTV